MCHARMAGPAIWARKTSAGTTSTPVMPGPAIRAWQLAKALGQHTEVVLASTVAVAGTHPNADLRLAYGPALAEMVGGADVSFAPSALVYMAHEFRATPNPVAVDI